MKHITKIIKIIIVCLAIFNTQAFNAQSTITFDSGYMDGAIIPDGTDLGSLTFLTESEKGISYNITQGYNNTAALYPNSFTQGNIRWVIFQKPDASDFKLVSLWLGQNIGDNDIEITGFLDDEIVYGPIIKTPASLGGDEFIINWPQIDKFKLSATTNLGCLIDHVIYDDPTLTSVRPTQTNKLDVRIFQNASTSQTIINSNYLITSIFLYDINGSEINLKPQTKSSRQLIFTTTQLTNGLYLLMVNTTKGHTVVKMIIN